jgi:cobalt/nickel transport system permease protein
MHIPDGLLPPEALVAGYAVTGVATWVSLRQIRQMHDYEAHIPKASLLTAAFFVASSVYVPVPPTSVHLILNGLLGVMLGWFAFPAILVGLLLQAIVFGHGGITTLGINASMMGLPALLGFALFAWRGRMGWTNRILTSTFAFIGGTGGLILAALIAYGVLLVTIPAYVDADAERIALTGLMVAYLPLSLIEGTITALMVGFLLRVQPKLIQGGA